MLCGSFLLLRQCQCAAVGCGSAVAGISSVTRGGCSVIGADGRGQVARCSCCDSLALVKELGDGWLAHTQLWVRSVLRSGQD